MDLFVDGTLERDAAWRPSARTAGASVKVSLAGAQVPLEPGGRFRLGPDACGRRLQAVDGAGGATAVVVRCERVDGELRGLEQTVGPLSDMPPPAQPPAAPGTTPQS